MDSCMNLHRIYFKCQMIFLSDKDYYVTYCFEVLQDNFKKI